MAERVVCPGDDDDDDDSNYSAVSSIAYVAPFTQMCGLSLDTKCGNKRPQTKLSNTQWVPTGPTTETANKETRERVDQKQGKEKGM